MHSIMIFKNTYMMVTVNPDIDYYFISLHAFIDEITSSIDIVLYSSCSCNNALK